MKTNTQQNNAQIALINLTALVIEISIHIVLATIFLSVLGLHFSGYTFIGSVALVASYTAIMTILQGAAKTINKLMK